MKSTSKKGSHKSSRKSRSRPLRKRRASPKEPSKSTRQVGTLRQELLEALEQQTATSEVLRIIATSPTDLQPVLDTLIANAVRLAGARQGHIREYDGELLRFVAHYNESPEHIAAIKASSNRVRPESYSGRAIIERRPVHILTLKQILVRTA